MQVPFAHLSAGGPGKVGRGKIGIVREETVEVVVFCSVCDGAEIAADVTAVEARQAAGIV